MCSSLTLLGDLMTICVVKDPLKKIVSFFGQKKTFLHTCSRHPFLGNLQKNSITLFSQSICSQNSFFIQMAGVVLQANHCFHAIFSEKSLLIFPIFNR